MGNIVSFKSPLEQFFYVNVMITRDNAIVSNAIISRNYIDIIRDRDSPVKHHQWLALIGLIETVYIIQHNED